jgi:uncharacterized RDD family membrane protein YckC
MMEERAAGFWVRFAAFWFDTLILYVGVTVAVSTFAHMDIYAPFELVLLLSLLIYSVGLTGWKGRTIGKALCGLTVRSTRQEAIGFGRALARETFGKLLSTVPFLLGFFWVAVSRRKRAWHDYVVQTVVVPHPRTQHQAHAAVVIALLGSCCAAGLYSYDMAELYRLYRRMAPPAGATAAYAETAPSSLTEVSSLGNKEQTEFVDWLNVHGQDPVDYAVEKAAEHQVVIFGESHERRHELQLLNDLIPELYRRAGVTCVAMEVCLANDNEQIDRLITAEEFDPELALQIARHQPWGMWGWKGYWDVLKTVWRLNQTISDDQQKVRVIGLDMPIDMPSLAMLGLEDNAGSDCPVWEKLRGWRLVFSLPRLAFMRDPFMARQVEAEIIEKGQRGIVWVGRNHSPTGSPQVVAPGRAWNRMGFLLHQRYGDKVFQIRLHGFDISAVYVDKDYDGPGPALAAFVENIMRKRGKQPVGFDVAPSPFSRLRDSGSFDFHFEPRLSFADVASGYIFLANRSDLKECQWMPGYISREMFVANKPFYQAFARRAGKEVDTADEFNDLFSSAMQ